MRITALLLLLLLTSCSLLPNSVVRVALPPGDTQAAADWERLTSALPRDADDVPIELVSPNSFPPPDLVWFGNSDDPTYLEQALAPNAEVATLGTAAGLSMAWFREAGDRLFPVAWNPWSWWQLRDGDRAPETTPDDEKALLAFQERTKGPSLGGGDGVVQSGPSGQVWLPAARVSASPLRTALTLVPAEVVVARVKGLWWNAQGWNPRRVPEVLARLWSPSAQAVWKDDAEWWPASRNPSAAVRTILVVP